MLKMQRDMDRIFSRMGTSEVLPTTGTTAWMPRINVKQSGQDLTVHVELAGIRPEDVDVEVTDGMLTLKGERKTETEREDEGWVIRESGYGSFERSIALPEGVDPSTITAAFRDGMLEIHVPRALELAEPHTTKIAIGAMPETKPLEATSAEVPLVPPVEPAGEQPELHLHH